MDRDNTIARLENIAKHAVHTAGEDTFILSLDDGLAIHEAIEALKAQLSCGGTTFDLISRQQALDIFDDYNVSVENGELEAYSRDRKRLCDLPPIQPEPKEGEWIEISSINHTYKCSECGRLLVNVTDGKNNVSKHYPYCHCGADMR